MLVGAVLFVSFAFRRRVGRCAIPVANIVSGKAAFPDETPAPVWKGFLPNGIDRGTHTRGSLIGQPLADPIRLEYETLVLYRGAGHESNDDTKRLLSKRLLRVQLNHWGTPGRQIATSNPAWYDLAANLLLEAIAANW